jgi:predicted amidohydrolase
VRITTVQWDTRQFDECWAQAAEARADLLVLPELGFSPWLADSPEVDRAAWARSIAQHEQRIGRLG